MSTRAVLTEAEVRAMGAALGFDISADDLAEVTHRLNAFVDALGRHDLLLSPAAPVPAPPIEREAEPVTSKAVAAKRFFGHRSHSTPASLAGLPAIAVPCGFSSDGLPLGLQLAGRPFDEATVLRAAHAYEQSTDWHTRRPALASALERA